MEERIAAVREGLRLLYGVDEADVGRLLIHGLLGAGHSPLQVVEAIGEKYGLVGMNELLDRDSPRVRAYREWRERFGGERW